MTRPRDERFTALAAVIGAHRQSSVVAMIRSSARTPRARGVISLLAGFALLASLAAAPMVRAASTLYVGPGGGSGACASPAYSAIQAGVNAAIAGDTIHVCAATYNLVAAISVPVNLTFEGDGAVSTIIDGSNGDAPVQILEAIGRTVTVSGLTFSHGHASANGGAILASVVNVSSSTFAGNGGDAGAFGGAIFAEGAVTISDSTFSGNTVPWTVGGGVYSGGGAVYSNTSVVATDSAFSGNAAYYGGAIGTDTAIVSNSTFVGNNGIMGGAVDADTATVTGSTFSGNTASYGGAIGDHDVAVANSTFSSNQADTWGGAIYANHSAAVTNATFSGNTAPSGGAIYAYPGVTITNSVLAQADATNNCANTNTDGGGSFSTDASCSFTQGTSHNSVALATLGLGALANNGGATQTIALGASSIAIDAALDGPCLAPPVNGVDQRGVARFLGAHCDSGAYEAPSIIPGATYVSLTPARLLDSRPGGTGLSGTFSSGVARTFTVRGVGGVPTSAVAVTGNLTVTGQTSPGFVALTPAPTNNPTTSTLNFPLGDNRANGVTVALSGTGTLSATYMGEAGPSATTHLIFDVTGYFVP